MSTTRKIPVEQLRRHVCARPQLRRGVSEIAYRTAAEHHERYDGTGYPRRLKGEEFSIYGQMMAIVDVYDAIASIRVYHKGMSPTGALRKIFEWSKFHFKRSSSTPTASVM